MSKLEFIKLCNGEILTNNTKHYENSASFSTGFCFLNYDEYKPEYARHFLSGVVDDEMCVIFDTKNILENSIGLYAKPLSIEEYKKMTILDLFDFSNIETIRVKEYCTTKYSKKEFKIIKYCECPQHNIFNTGDFEWIEYHD